MSAPGAHSSKYGMTLIIYFLEHIIMTRGLKMENLLTEKESADLPDMPPLESDEEEVRREKGIKNLTPNKLLTRLPILLAQIKAGNNSHKLKNKIRQILYILYQH